jgi:hypothetical protein
MRTATGSFRLDAAGVEFFRSRRLRMIQRGPAVFGRFGRYGSLHGIITLNEVRAMWREGDRRGWMALTFDPTFRKFVGEYGIGAWPSEVAGRCSGTTALPPPQVR